MRLIFIQVFFFFLFAAVFDHWVERERAKQVCFVALGRGSSPKAQRAGWEKQDLNLANVTMYSDGLICLELLVLVEVVLPPTLSRQIYELSYTTSGATVFSTLLEPGRTDALYLLAGTF